MKNNSYEKESFSFLYNEAPLFFFHISIHLLSIKTVKKAIGNIVFKKVLLFDNKQNTHVYNSTTIRRFYTTSSKRYFTHGTCVNSGHPGGSLGCAEFITCLYQEVMEYSTDFKMDGIMKIYSFCQMVIFLLFFIVF